ncbi:MAG: hypothetical protein CMI76_01650 [Candidatus Pelagibacter sp.]|nr:hypothetical protein [Candidatus Pelagibacter sp.]|tara:strand:+ start:5728 stop:6435 length:708 start_codon:yes stop_codon:yes gene_type:complete
MTKAIPLEDNFDWWWYRSKKNFLRYILNKHLSKKNLNILEIGPGKGNNLGLLKAYGNVSVLEVEKEFSSYLLNKNVLNKDEIFYNFDQIINKKSFDLIVLLDVLEHVEDTNKFLYEINKLIKETGIVVFSVPAYNSLWSSHDEDLHHVKRYNWRTIKSEVGQYFSIIDKYGMNFILLPIRYLQLKFTNPTTLNDTSKTLNSILYLIAFLEAMLLKIKINPKFGLSLYFVTKNKQT